jgi:nucleotide-binding universal stress UspA family protein
MSAPILVASDGGPSSKGALHMAARLQVERDVGVEVLAVVQPIPRYGVGHLATYPDGYRVYEAVQAESLKQAVEQRLRETGGGAPDWTVRVETGARAPTIAQHARVHGSPLILLGTGEHAPLDRWLGDETALKVARLATVPVLAVPRDWTGTPSRVLIPTDFSEHSLRAAQAAVALLSRPAHLILAHVMWPGEEAEAFPSLTEWRHTYQQGAEARLREIGGQLRGELRHTVESIVVSGDPADEILSLARRLNVDLIAAGSHGYGFVGRLVMGSVSTQLLRGGFCPVMIVPPATPPKDLAATTEAGREPAGEAATAAQPAATRGML